MKKLSLSFFKWCSRNSFCAFHHTKDFPTTFDNFINTANNNPIPAPQCLNTSSPFYPCAPSVSGYGILKILQEALIVQSADNGLSLPGWVAVSNLLMTAVQGNDASTFAKRNLASPTDSDIPYTAIICVDWNNTSLSWPEYQYKMIMAEVISLHTRGQGEFWNLQARCMNWPAPVANFPHSIEPTLRNLTLTTPVLLVNAFYDSESAYPFAVNLQERGKECGVIKS